MPLLSSIAAFGLTLGLASSALAGDFSCPDEISSQQSLGAHAPPGGWTAWVDSAGSRHWNSMVDFYDGEPSGMAQLAPDNADAPESAPRRWVFVADKGQSEARIWQVCRYTSTTVTLTRRLAAGLKGCTVTHKKGLGSSGLSVSCK